MRRVKPEPPLRVTFDRRIKLEFHGARITSDAGLLAYREVDDVFDLTAMAASNLGEGRRGKNIRHRLLGLLRQAVYGRLAGYEDVNDAERLARDPVMRAMIASVFQALRTTGQSEPEKTVETLTPAVPIKKSVQQNFIVCLEDGKKLKMLKRHLAGRYNMTPEDYRRRWGLAKDYPMVAPAYAAQRSALAREIGLGRKPAAPVAAEPPAAKTAPARRVGGRRKPG